MLIFLLLHLVVGDFNSEGTASFTSVANFSDNAKAQFGNANDLQIYHDASNSYIRDAGTGNLYIDATSSIIFRDFGSAEEMAKFINDGAIELYYDNTKRFETTSTGIAVSGAVSITADGSNAATFTESGNGLLTIATVDDFVVDAGGDISLDSGGLDLRLKANGNTYGYFNGASDSFYIGAGTQDKDIIFIGNDGGSQISMLTLDASNAGSATFNDDIDFGGKLTQTGTGTNNFNGNVQVKNNSSAGYSVISGDGNGGIYSANGDVQLYTNNTAYAINFYSANKGSKLMTVVDNGDILMGNTVVNPASGFASQKGFGYDGGTGQTQIATTDNASTLVLGRNNATDGSIIDLRKESITVGTFGSNATSGEPVFDISASSSNGHMRFLTDGSEAIRINKTQKVGIGTPTQLPEVLNVNGNIITVGASTNTGYDRYLKLYGNTEPITNTNRWAGLAVYNNGGNNVNELAFFTGSGDSARTEKVRIDASGKMGINTQTPNGLLNISNGGANG